MTIDADGDNPGYKVLCIEDDYLDALANHLTQHGYRLSRAFQGYRAEELLDEEGNSIDLILLGHDGPGTTRSRTRIQPGEHTGSLSNGPPLL